MKLFGCLLGYAIAMAAANLFFKASADSSGRMFWFYYILGNASGFVCTLFIPLALRLGSPSVVYAMAIGGGFVLLQLASYMLFQQALTGWQWAGIALISAGIIMLQITRTE